MAIDPSLLSAKQAVSTLCFATIIPPLLAAALLFAYYRPALFRRKTAVSLSLQFVTRYDFLINNFKRTGEKLFQFKGHQHIVIATSGEDARRVFFNDKSLDLSQGYLLLQGGSPQLSDIKQSSDSDNADPARVFVKHFVTVYTGERIAALLPALLAGMNKQSLSWGKKALVDPFKDIYDIAFQITIRAASCSELTDNSDASAQLAACYWAFEKSSTPMTVLLPWLPSKAKKEKERAIAGLFTLLMQYVSVRKQAKVPSVDSIDVLLQDGVDDASIVQFMMNAIFAGVINTGMIACWFLFHLHASSEWKTKLQVEVSALLDKYTIASGQLLHERLASIPVEALENEMPLTDLALRETICITLANHTALRRNVGEDLKIGDKVVPRGAFLAYSLADVHFDEHVYPNATKWDPARFDAGREEDKKAPSAFLGWGTGRHPCTGMKIAKLEIKIIIAFLLAGFEYSVVDEKGDFPDPFPVRDPRDLQRVSNRANFDVGATVTLSSGSSTGQDVLSRVRTYP